MDLKGSIVDTNIRIYPSQKLISYIETISFEDHVPDNFLQFIMQKSSLNKKTTPQNEKQKSIQLNNKDIENLSKIKEVIGKIESAKSIASESTPSSDNSSEKDIKEIDSNEQVNKIRMNGEAKSNVEKNEEKKQLKDEVKKELKDEDKSNSKEKDEDKSNTKENYTERKSFLITSDLDWLYLQLNKLRNKNKGKVPHIHELLEDSEISMPENKIIKRNPVLEARCVKLRAQQEAREYRKMTKSVDNVRMRFPEDSISYQLKQINRQLIAVAQFILSIFAGFLFGFKGIEWMIGPMDFGVKLLLGVMCSLIIALAEIYFLAKKLNEELNVPETVQLGGPPKFVDNSMNNYANKTKEHLD